MTVLINSEDNNNCIMIEIRVAILRGGAAGAAAILCACTRTLCITRVYQLCERGWFPDVNNTGEIRHKNLVSELLVLHQESIGYGTRHSMPLLLFSF